MTSGERNNAKMITVRDDDRHTSPSSTMLHANHSGFVDVSPSGGSDVDSPPVCVEVPSVDFPLSVVVGGELPLTGE